MLEVSSTYLSAIVQPADRTQATPNIGGKSEVDEQSSGQNSFLKGKDSYEKAIVVVSGEYNGEGAIASETQKTKKEGTQKAESGKSKTEEAKEQEPVVTSSTEELSEEAETEVENLKKIDTKTRAHEAAHVAAGGGLVRGGANFSYTKGPDGKQYATAGEVQIDISPIDGDPKATIRKMDQVKRAALAPADPSTQDRSVASRATQIQSRARAELASENSAANANSDSVAMENDSTKIKPQEETTVKKNFSKSIFESYIKNENQNQNEMQIGSNIDYTSAAGAYVSLQRY